jgi:phosphoglycolate phosphatase-like HAD superfamily hydrolase
MPLEALIFDVDGTVAETEEIYRQAFNQTFASLGEPGQPQLHLAGWQWPGGALTLEFLQSRLRKIGSAPAKTLTFSK